MPLYYFAYLIISLGASFLLARYLILRRTSLPTKLFMKGIKAENNGLYEEAATSYEDALREIKKTRFHRNLEIEIRQKLKVLHTVTTYTKDQDFVRENNSWIR
jgi:hypothetical protein